MTAQAEPHVKFVARLTVIIAVSAVFLAVGYWWGNTRSGPSPAVTSEPRVPSALSTTKKGKILYYRNPMGYPDTSPVPKKDSMGMDYLPVYEGEEHLADSSAVNISPEKIQKLGVRTEAVSLRELIRTVKAVATVQADERRLHTVAPKFEGWIQRLYVNTTGQAVRKGDALMDVYSPELITAQHEYLIAAKGFSTVEQGSREVRAGMEHLAESALQRLRNWDIAEIELQQLQQEGRVSQYLTLR